MYLFCVRHGSILNCTVTALLHVHCLVSNVVRMQANPNQPYKGGVRISDVDRGATSAQQAPAQPAAVNPSLVRVAPKTVQPEAGASRLQALDHLNTVRACESLMATLLH